MPQFELLGSLTQNLHQEFVRIYYLMLPVFFALAVAVAWFRSPQGSIEFLDVLKRALISTLLLVAFPDISRAILFIADGITERIDALNSLDTMIRMAQEKAQGYSLSPTSILLQFNDLIIATLSFLSYIVLYVARYLTIAMYHFFWIFFMVSAPLLLLFNMFRSTSQITANLFKGMIEVASWKIVWAILGAMLSALSFGNAYRAEGNYLTLMVMNFVIATAMLATPLIVRSIVGSGLQAASSTLGPAAVAAMIAAPARVAMVAATSRGALNAGQTFARDKIEKFKPRNHLQKGK
ncbi:MAG TPA: hypothetical protein DCS07_11855 [Bdellovibrionales bacterium]|nr:MAG: hypothetical protein A2Z97_03555 [Bdellovibrionales bacterium GWB1_52_6]OFZ04028.1 MAG: hypothetical protein A2X97_14590 [Bdellovibrionales bacterium GWA1_52_35]HAR43303.1 hypothetical protein [Bdellovibrionales bacterium]HCM39887.1 hypothetical protein [Bdellovibrionales bacterium]